MDSTNGQINQKRPKQRRSHPFLTSRGKLFQTDKVQDKVNDDSDLEESNHTGKNDSLDSSVDSAETNHEAAAQNDPDDDTALPSAAAQAGLQKTKHSDPLRKMREGSPVFYIDPEDWDQEVRVPPPPSPLLRQPAVESGDEDGSPDLKVVTSPKFKNYHLSYHSVESSCQRHRDKRSRLIDCQQHRIHSLPNVLLPLSGCAEALSTLEEVEDPSKYDLNLLEGPSRSKVEDNERSNSRKQQHPNCLASPTETKGPWRSQGCLSLSQNGMHSPVRGSTTTPQRTRSYSSNGKSPSPLPCLTMGGFLASTSSVPSLVVSHLQHQTSPRQQGVPHVLPSVCRGTSFGDARIVDGHRFRFSRTLAGGGASWANTNPPWCPMGASKPIIRERKIAIPVLSSLVKDRVMSS